MKSSVKAALLGASVFVLVAGAFWGGTVFGGSADRTGVIGSGDVQDVRGGPFAELTVEERSALENMTDEERQAWMQKNVGTRSDGAQDGPARGGTLEGEVIEATDESITISLASGSQTVYLDDMSVVAYVEDSGELVAGADVIVIAAPAGGLAGESSTTGSVLTASIVVVM